VGENAKCSAEFERSHRYLWLAARLLELASKWQSWKDSVLLPLVLLGRAQERIDRVVFVEVHFAEMSEDRQLFSEWALLHSMQVKCCLSIFTNIKASHRKQRQLNWCFLSSFYFLSIISAFATNKMSFIKTFTRLRIYFFRCMITVLSESKKNSLYKYSFNTTVVSNGLNEAMFVAEK